MDSLYWAAFLSFIAGICGYIIIRFWIVPIVRYRRIKGRLRSGISAYLQRLPADSSAKTKGVANKKALRDIRQSGSHLVDLYNGELPYWYRLVLMTHKESPPKAADPIMRLENMPTSGQARQCIGVIGEHLRFRIDL